MVMLRRLLGGGAVLAQLDSPKASICLERAKRRAKVGVDMSPRMLSGSCQHTIDFRVDILLGVISNMGVHNKVQMFRPIFIKVDIHELKVHGSFSSSLNLQSLMIMH